MYKLLFGCGFLLLITLSSPINASTYFVPDDFATIQDAINGCANGATIIVRPGKYYENIDFVGKAITVKSELGAAVTTIDGNQAGSVVKFQTGEGLDSILEGFTITNGMAPEGGGIYCINSAPEIRGNTILMNTAKANGSPSCGGGIFSKNSAPNINDNKILENTAGGFVYDYSYGGGICCMYSSPNIHGNRIARNISKNYERAYGGGIYCSYADHTTVVITNNTISQNEVIGEWAYGGGIHCNARSAILRGNIVLKNLAKASDHGDGAVSEYGGIYCGGDLSSRYVIVGNIVAKNAATTGHDNGDCEIICRLGGLVIGGIQEAIVVNNTVFDNKGDYSSSSFPDPWEGNGIYTNCKNTTIINCIVWGNESWGMPGGQCWNQITGGGGGKAIFCDVEGGHYGKGNIDTDPLFVDPDLDDFHLMWDSPCRNTGTNLAIPSVVPYDFEGDPRICHGMIDMGADEFHTHLYHTGDVLPGSPIDVKVIGDPGITPVTLAVGLGIQDPPQSTPCGDLYLLLPLDWKPEIGTIPTTGVLIYTDTVPLHWLPGQEYPFQALLGPLASGSELTNLMLITVE